MVVMGIEGHHLSLQIAWLWLVSFVEACLLVRMGVVTHYLCHLKSDA
jgi:hypothetical protein